MSDFFADDLDSNVFSINKVFVSNQGQALLFYLEEASYLVLLHKGPVYRTVHISGRGVLTAGPGHLGQISQTVPPSSGDDVAFSPTGTLSPVLSEVVKNRAIMG